MKNDIKRLKMEVALLDGKSDDYCYDDYCYDNY